MNHYTTHELLEKERFSYWSDLVCNTYAKVSANAEQKINYNGSIVEKPFGRITLTRCAGDPIYFKRSSHDIKTDHRDEIQLSLLVTGKFVVEQLERQTVLTHGDLILYDSTKQFELFLLEKFDTFTARIPKSLFGADLEKIEALCGLPVRNQTLVAQLLKNMMDSLISTNADNSNQTINSLITNNYIDLLVAAFSSYNDDISTDSKIGRHIKDVKRYLKNQMENPEIDINQIAIDMAMSPRTLHRLFAAEGETVMGWLWSQRLKEVHKKLELGEFNKIGDAALSFGFKDFSHFSKSFKKEFGYTPTSILRQKM